MRGFEELGRICPRRGLRGIIGAIDCTHIRIARTRNCPDTERFRNRKGYYFLLLSMLDTWEHVEGDRNEDFGDVVGPQEVYRKRFSF